eukprot:11099-Pyramimonas_sp.AAC.1
MMDDPDNIGNGKLFGLHFKSLKRCTRTPKKYAVIQLSDYSTAIEVLSCNMARTADALASAIPAERTPAA